MSQLHMSSIRLTNGIKMSAPGTMDEVGQSHAYKDMVLDFQVPTVPSGGTARDMGSLALFLVANWFVNGEVVLIDGGVSLLILETLLLLNPLLLYQTLLKHPSSW